MIRKWTIRLFVAVLIVTLVVSVLPGSWEFWRTVALLSAAVGQTLFVALYATFPWWEKFLGRALFFKALALGALADVAVAGRIWDWPYEDQTFTVLYWTLSLGIWAQAYAFLRVRLRHQQRNVSGNEGSR